MNENTKTTGTEVATKQQGPAEVFRVQLHKMDSEFKAALPDHIPVDRFKRVVQTAVNQNPDLFDADRRSLFQACTLAAQDGLLPDGRKAALVIFNTKVKFRDENGQQKEVWVKKVQYMPMIAGILEKVRNSAQLSGISSNVVYAGDDFDYELGDNERIYHKPNLQNRGAPIAAYAIAHLKDGMVEREVMSVREVEEVRAISRAKDAGPWKNWWGEMARKTVMRRLSKRLPMSSDLDTVIRRDDELYNVNEPKDALPAPPRPVRADYIEHISNHPDAKERGTASDGESEDPKPKDTAEMEADHAYDLTNWDGEVSSFKFAGAFTDAFAKAIEAAPDLGALQGLFETNKAALDRLGNDGEQGPGWREELNAESGKRYAALIGAPKAKAPEPASAKLV